MTCILTLLSLVLCLGVAGTDILKFLQPVLVVYESSQCVPNLRHMSYCLCWLNVTEFHHE